MSAPQPSVSGRGARAALRRIGPPVAFGALPVAAVLAMFTVALTEGPLALDFRQELYPQARAALEGRNPFVDAIWPPAAVAAALPFGLLPSDAADAVFAAAGLVCVGLALWVTGVRDWRVFGVVALWPSVLGEIRISHFTPLLCLLLALTWRHQTSPTRSGVALGLAGGVKFFLWPVGVWLLSTGRARAATIAATTAAATVLLIALFVPLGDYLGVLRKVSSTFDQDSYSVFGMLTQLGASDTVARISTFALGSTLLVLTWARRSFALSVAAALVLSPIVWLDYYALTAVPLAVVAPRLSWVWFLPLLTWGLPSSGIAADAIWGVGRVLLVFAVLVGVARATESRAAA